MSDALFFLFLLVGYIVLMRWILPKLGIPTWMSGSCKVESRPP